MKRVFLFFVFASALAVTSYGQGPSVVRPADTLYNELSAKLKAGDTKVDYKALRMAFAESKDFGASGVGRELRAKMVKAHNEKKYKDAVAAASEILKTNYLDIETHMIMAMANNELGDGKASKFHEAVYVGLVNSILSDGDGNSTKTAYKVIAVSEESAVVRALELKRGSQALLEEGGQKFDVLTVTDPTTNAPQQIFFNIDLILKAQIKMRTP